MDNKNNNIKSPNPILWIRLLFPLLLGLLAMGILIAGAIVFWVDMLRQVSTQYFYAVSFFILFPTSMYFLIFGYYRMKMRWPFLAEEPLGNVNENKKALSTLFKSRRSKLIMGVFMGLSNLAAVLIMIFTFPPYWMNLQNNIGHTTIRVFLLATSLLFLLNMLLAREFLSDGMKRITTLYERWKKKHKILEEGDMENYHFHLSSEAYLAMWVILIITGVTYGGITLSKPKTCYDTQGSFNDPAYTIPEGAHENSALDSFNSANQTYLNALEKSLHSFTQLQRGGGFPMRSEADGSFMYSDRGEDCPLHPLEFSLQSGTGIVGDVYLAMYDLEPNDVYLNVAKDVGEALIAVQDEKNGGFYYDGRRHEDGSGFQPHPRNERRTNVLDDNVMQSAMSFLLSLYNVTGENKYLESLNKGFDLLFEIEKEGGGWPQRTNYMENEYQSYITLNDDSMEDIFNLMLKAHEILGDEKYMNAAKRVGRFLIRVQGNGGSEFQQAWAQQYQNDQPAWARVFEPKSMCSKQTANGIEMLMELYLITGNATYLEPIPAAINWLNSSQTIIPLTDNPGEYGWSRLYELETNKPIVGNRNNWGNNVDYYYDYDPERDYGYSWEGTYGINTTLSNYAKLLELNNNTQQYLNWREQIQFNSFANEPDSETETLSEEGFWIDEDDGLIHSSTFVSKAMKYINYFTYLTEAD